MPLKNCITKRATRALWFSASLGAIALVFATIGCRPDGHTKSDMVEPQTVRATIATVSLEDTDQNFEATGTVRAKFNAILASKVMARVTDVRVREGDAIRAGQVLVSLDPRELSSSVDVASANLRSAQVGVGNAETVARMQESTSAAGIAEAQAQVTQSVAALNAAQSRLDLALAGPRPQERIQAKVAVERAKSSLTLAETELDRAKRLYASGAIAKRDVDYAQNAYDLAQGQYETAVQSQKIAEEGTRPEDIRAAREAVAQAQAAHSQALAGLQKARAAALEAQVRKEDIKSAQAQVNQSKAALRAAQVTLSYATVLAPFDGKVVKRNADPGAMAAPGVPLLEVEGGGLRLEALVPESVLPKVSVGESVQLMLDAMGDEATNGKVVEIVPQGDASTHSFLVRVEVPEGSGAKSGMFGRVRFPIGRHKRFLIPSDATWVREGLNYVFAVNKDGIARLRIITIGDTFDRQVEVLSGLASGDRIVIKGREGVADGNKVEGQ